MALVMATIMVIAEAAGLVAPGRMPARYEEAARAQGQKPALKLTKQLPKQDPLGVVPGIATIPPA
ncbi:hypothetical protein [Streptomyces yangpuensis]|uniref:hypothetical protein n=1 Tax=Streptomyces yangpuensis TaxID=1648182 RepID=UPI0036483711